MSPKSWNPFVRHLTVPAGQVCVEHVDGAVRRLLEPGRYRRPRRATYTGVPTTEQLLTTATQRVPDADGVVVQATVTVRWRVVDAAVHVAAADEPTDLLYLAAQLAVRDVVGAATTDDLVRGRGPALDETALTEAARSRVADLGIEVRQVVLKDVVLPPEVREAYAAQLTARLQGQASLERARAEVASLRALANGARLLEEHPALARLRLVEAVPMGSSVRIEV
ncbi:slipin family protein [Nocardioides sp. ChNu-153]|uniref:slipin family protein n=1 Tax=unclassified Nocardioides TaxID=2615069 RepID=UPI0024072DCC|nr:MULTISPECIES: slipin family protein [unclassified Nocardioides]MDF9715718.1 slipin family protein [Nocardioides sp. ChNu-99]MDN7121701.1 slipin family protein [Nocardioides sp. ChNu-153]